MDFRSYREFWPFYVSQHLKPATRFWHFIGTSCVFLGVIGAIVSRNWWFIVAIPVISYGLAWFSHFTFEHNKPATFGHPVWSLRADFQMYFYIATERMGSEVRKIEFMQDESGGVTL